MPRRIFLHHLLVTTGLYFYFAAIDNGKDKAVWFTVLFVVMNYSTVCQNARWAIRGTKWESHRPWMAGTLAVTTLLVYALTRIGL